MAAIGHMAFFQMRFLEKEFYKIKSWVEFVPSQLDSIQNKLTLGQVMANKPNVI